MPSVEVIKLRTDAARGNLAKVIAFDADGRAKVDISQEWLEEHGHLIKRIETWEESRYVKRIELYSAERAQQDLAKIHKLVGPDVQNNISVHLHADRMGNEELVARLRELDEKIAALEAGGGGGYPLLTGREVGLDDETLDDETLDDDDETRKAS